MSKLKSFRKDKDHFFASHPQSPLTHEQKQHFKGLDYYPENEEQRLEVEVEQFSDVETLELQTTTGDIQTYTRFGEFKFNIDGQEAKLTIYGGHHDFFLPFADSLAGDETYGAGRYLEPQPLGNGKFLIDFNLAYNPYCAYNEPHSLAARAGRAPMIWSCPITPFENRLKVPIRAGEKIPHGDWVDHELHLDEVST
jgi:uncharacterized protein (DUF1684 family)